MKKVLVILLVAVVAAVVLWRISASSTARTNSQQLALAGNVDIRETQLGFRVPGKILEVLVEEGDAVTNGAVLGRLDPEPFEKRVRAAAAQVEAARANLGLLKAGYRTGEIAQARAVLRERTVSCENAKRLYDRQEELLRNNTVSQQERDDSEARYREAEARLHSAREHLALLEAGFRREDIAAAEAELERVAAGLASAQLELADTVLTAPADGMILTRSQEPGAVVQAGGTILTLSVQDVVWVRAYIHEPDMGRIHPGMEVQVITDSFPDKPLKGQIGYISPRAEFTPRNVETRELRTSLVYRVRVTVSDPEKTLRQGMPVTVRIPGNRPD